MVASYVGTATTGLLSKSVNADDLKLDEETGAYDQARAQYFDALIAANSSTAAPETKRFPFGGEE